MQYFTSEKLSPNTTRIKDLTHTYMYLVEGHTEALLIDTGSGLGNLKTYVDSLTTLPVTVILTHGHVDHVGGSAPFEKVYLHEADFALAGQNNTHDYKLWFTQKITKKTYTDIAPDRDAAYLPVCGGEVFDLGGIHIELLALPGHTQGMLCPFIREERRLIVGDGCNARLFLFLPESSTVEQYKEALSVFISRCSTIFDTVYGSHESANLPRQILDVTLEVCMDILEGRSDEMPFAFLGKTWFVAKKTDARGNRLDGKCGNIIYDRNRIR